MAHAARIASGICRGGMDAAAGNIILFRAAGSERYNHGAIVIEWPRILHAVFPRVTETDARKHALTGFKPFELFDPWRRPEEFAA